MQLEQTMNIKKLLLEASQLIQNGWHRGYYAADADDNKVQSNSPLACKFCALGAIERVTLSIPNRDMRFVANVECRDLLNKAAQKLTGSFSTNMVEYNDKVASSTADMAKLFEEAIKGLPA